MAINLGGGGLNRDPFKMVMSTQCFQSIKVHMAIISVVVTMENEARQDADGL